MLQCCVTVTTDKLTSRNKSDMVYPSPPASDVELSSKIADDENDSEQYLQLPHELEIDEDRLVRSENRPLPTSFFTIFSLLTGAPSTHESSITSRASPPSSSLSSSYTGGRRGNVANSSHNFRRSSEQLEIASTVQTIPQETGFFTILGPFLVDMSIELAVLFWFFISEVLWPKILLALKFLATPILVWIPIILPIPRYVSNLPVTQRPASNRRATTPRLPIKDLPKWSRTREPNMVRRRKMAL